MALPIDIKVTSDRDLAICYELDAPRAAVWRCWTEPELLKQWFAPKPWTTPQADFELRPGGASLIVMRSPEGQDMPNPGQYLEVSPGTRLVFTDAYIGDWATGEKPFFTAVLTFEDAGPGRTKYTALARHWSLEDAERHSEMGFHGGWGLCTEQLEALARTL